MNDVPYSPSLRQMAFVQRWSIARCTRRPNIAEHSFFVAIYADMVAERIEWYMDLYAHQQRSTLLWRALYHDVEEIVTGDMPGPGKHEFVDIRFHSAWVTKYLRVMLGAGRTDELNHKPDYDIKAILKVANLLDEVFFLADESAMGNRWVRRVSEDVMRRLREAWRALPATEEVLDREWKVVDLAITGHLDPKPIIPGMD